MAKRDKTMESERDVKNVAVPTEPTVNTAASEANEGAVYGKVTAESFLVAAPNGLNLRDEPDGAILGVLPDGTKVTVNHPVDFSRVPGWVPVDADEGLAGWVQTAFLRRIPET